MKFMPLPTLVLLSLLLLVPLGGGCGNDSFAVHAEHARITTQLGQIAANIEAIRRDGIAMPRGSDATTVLSRMRPEVWAWPYSEGNPNVPAVLFVYTSDARANEWPSIVMSNPAARGVRGGVSYINIGSPSLGYTEYEGGMRLLEKGEIYAPSGQRLEVTSLWPTP